MVAKTVLSCCVYNNCVLPSDVDSVLTVGSVEFNVVELSTVVEVLSAPVTVVELSTVVEVLSAPVTVVELSTVVEVLSAPVTVVELSTVVEVLSAPVTVPETIEFAVYTHGKKLGNTSCVTKVNLGLKFTFILKMF